MLIDLASRRHASTALRVETAVPSVPGPVDAEARLCGGAEASSNVVPIWAALPRRAREEAMRRDWECEFDAGGDADPFAPGGPWGVQHCA